jgi:hypothetical protein
MTAMRVIIGADRPPTDPVAAHLRASFAERHVPLPGPLATALARILSAPQPLLDPVWGRAFARMVQALGTSGAVASQQLLKGAMDRFLLVVAEPVLRQAANRAGVLALAGTGGGDAPSIAEAEDRIAQQVDAALRDPQVMGLPFWAHAALDLNASALRKARARARLAADSFPDEIDPALAALVFLHPPDFENDLHREKKQRMARQVSAQRRAGIRPKEGGVAGILQSRQLDDLPDALMSELILPRALFANKLLHEGILVRHRPPRRDPRRDLLAVMLHQVAPGDGMGTLVQAAWADAAIRLRVALFQMGLANSDLVWSGPGTALDLGCNLDLPGIERFPPLRIAGKARADMLMRSGLYPAHATLPRTAAIAPEGDAMVNRLRAGLLPLARTHKRDVHRIVQDYGRRFLLVSQPHQGRQNPDWAEIRARLSASLDRDLGRSHTACLTWVARGADQPPVLWALADGREPVEMAPPTSGADEDDVTLAGFIGDLVLWIMDVTLEALDVSQT